MVCDTSRPCVRPLLCPVCDLPLEQAGRTLRCARRHSFDIAREGYVNLMMGHKRPPILGDAKVMLRARRRFLANGHYAPLSEAINQIVLAHLADGEGGETAVLDIGCGEGYLIGQLQSQLPETACTFGLDAAKEAARLAARRHTATRFIVANINHRIPFADQSLNALLNIFAPRHPAEFARIAAPGALLLIVIPQSNHLQSLRAELELLDIEPDKRPRIIAQMAAWFTLRQTQSLSINLDLAQPALTDLVQMTPNYWHLTPEKQAQLQAMSRFQTAARFELLTLTKERMKVDG